MVSGSRFQKRLCLVAARVMPVAFCVLVHPRRRPPSSAFGVNAGAKLNVRGVRIVRPDDSRRFLLVYYMGNAVPQIASVNGAQLFRISLCHQTDLFQPAQQCRLNLSRNLFAVVVGLNVHRLTPHLNQMLAVSHEIHVVYVQKPLFFFFRNIGFGNKQTVIVLFGCLGQKIHIFQCKKHISFPFQNLYNLFCNFARLIR
nr:MAG TPA: hypothetical protein [Caudoviricetes sp.]